jgi:L-fucose mutarotase
MLKGIDPLLSPDLLATLRAMGHGDEIAIVDANFPATSVARRRIRLDGVSATAALDAVLSVMPLDDFAAEAAWRMAVVDAPEADLPIFAAFRVLLATREGRDVALPALERFAFYERARTAFAVIATGEIRLYGNIILRKGIVRPEISLQQ